MVEVRERDEAGEVWLWSDTGSTDFEDSDSDDPSMPSLGSSSSRSRSMLDRHHSQDQQQQQGQQVDASGFPPDALQVARLGAALLAAGEPGLQLAMPSRSSPSNPSSISSPSSISRMSKGSSPWGSRGSSSSRCSVYLVGLDPASVSSATQALGLAGQLEIASRLQEADAVLALRSKLKTSECAGLGCQEAAIRGQEVPHGARRFRFTVGLLAALSGSVPC